jgi:UPF0755 protein
MKKTTLFLGILALMALGFFMIFQEGSLPVDKNNQGAQIFVVEKGQGLKSIINNLASEGLIRNKVVFYLVVKQKGIEKKIQAGDFRLSKNMNAGQIADELTHGTTDTWVTVIEGLRKEEVAQILTETVKTPTFEFIEQAREGYLFPDTYLVPKDASIDAILAIFQKNFDAKYTPEVISKVRRLGLTEREGVIIASLVEKEARFPEDKRKVAGILIKRYKEDWLMQLDATIQYAIGYQKNEKTWWKKDLTLDDIEVDSTYNTYKYQGLPPAPICSPGLESLVAVAEADVQTPYYYYISDRKGNMHYARTLEEHNANIAQYLQ